MTYALTASLHPTALDHASLLLDVGQREHLSTPQLAYVLATALHESHLGLWMEDHSGGRDGPRYRGRGYARLVGRTNYGRWAEHLNLPLLERPEMAAVPEIAAEIIVKGMKHGRFTGRTLADYINDTTVDYVRARRVMPATERPIRIAGHARRFEAQLDSVALLGPTAADVRRVQHRLSEIGWPLAIDGALGPFTRRAVSDFQHGYALTDLPLDGWPDPVTRLALDRCAQTGGYASPHFRFAEFRTGGAPDLSATNRVIRVERRLLLALERYRRTVDRAVVIASGYRSVPYNRAVGARHDSEHLLGRAVHVEPELPTESVLALGMFSSVGHRNGVAIHLGVAAEMEPTTPRVYPLA